MDTDKRHSAPVWPPAQSEGALEARRHHAERRADDNRIELRTARPGKVGPPPLQPPTPLASCSPWAANGRSAIPAAVTLATGASCALVAPAVFYLTEPAAPGSGLRNGNCSVRYSRNAFSQQ